MKTRVISTCLMPRGEYVAITLFGLVFVPRGICLSPTMLNHERIHCKQQLEWLYVPFMLLYVAEWIVGMIRFRNWGKAYRNISFEREAYAHQNDSDYPAKRRHYQNYRRET